MKSGNEGAVRIDRAVNGMVDILIGNVGGKETCDDMTGCEDTGYKEGMSAFEEGDDETSSPSDEEEIEAC